MKTVALIILIVAAEIALMFWLSGCATVAPAVPQKAFLSPVARAQPSSVILPPPVTNAITLHFFYAQWPLTNGYVQSSPDLHEWEARDDATIVTNDDASVYWSVPSDGSPNGFFRAGGDTIPGVTTNVL